VPCAPPVVLLPSLLKDSKCQYSSLRKNRIDQGPGFGQTAWRTGAQGYSRGRLSLHQLLPLHSGLSSRIDLQNLWNKVRELLLQRGIPTLSVLSPLSFYRGLTKGETAQRDYEKPLTQAREAIAAQCDLMKKKDEVLPLPPTDRKFKSGLSLSAQSKTFSVCFGCQTCTTVCPVVGNYENPQEALGLLPHQIMHAAGLGLRDLAFGSNMLWIASPAIDVRSSVPRGIRDRCAL